MKSVLMKLSAAAFGVALLAGCASIGVKAHKGAVVDPQLASAIQPGVDNKASVEKTLGRPSFTGQFTPNDWYYVSRDTNQFAFRNPRVKQQTVYRVRFDQAGNVIGVDKSGKEMIAAVEPGLLKCWPTAPSWPHSNPQQKIGAIAISDYETASDVVVSMSMFPP